MAPRTTPEKIKAKAAMLYGQGLTLAECAKAVGRSARTIEKWSAEQDWPELRSQLPKREKAKVAERKDLKQQLSVLPGGKKGFTLEQLLKTAELAISLVEDAIEDSKLNGSYRQTYGLVQSLHRLVELRPLLAPSSASEIAQAAIALRIRPEVFVEELARQWDLHDEQKTS